jgi:formylglycine-generating enzyme required for sulfatase activity
MGSPDGERARRASEGPVVEVSLAKPFALARSETTVAQWNECVAAGPCAPLREEAGANRPAVNVSFDDAEVFARWLSEKTGASYRLPSEAEWEYAARAGAETPFASGPSISAREASFDASIPYGGKPGVPRRAPSPVASFPANAFGLYDMAGNVWEWTADCWSPSHAGAPADGAPRSGACSQRVLKGGAWNTGGWRLRAAHRIGKPAGAREYDNGFRVARDL